MQLRNARLCLDCEEVHDAEQCPICASEMFASITRWVPAPERRTRPRTAPPNERADVYRELLNSEPRPSTARRLLKGGALGLTAVGLIGWLVRQNRSRDSRDAKSWIAFIHLCSDHQQLRWYSAPHARRVGWRTTAPTARADLDV